MGPRFVTVLDDVIIAVPESEREIVDAWCLEHSRSRKGLEYHSDLLLKAQDPKPAYAARLLGRSLRRRTTRSVRRLTGHSRS